MNAPAKKRIDPSSEKLEVIVMNHAGTTILILIAFLLYNAIPFYRSFFTIEAKIVMKYAIIFFMFFGWIPSLFIKDIKPGKGYIFLYESISFIKSKVKRIPYKSKYDFGFSAKVALLKFIYIAIMLQYSVGNFYGLKSRIISFSFSPFSINSFNNVYYPLVLSIIFFIDVLIVLFAYCVELPCLKNTIKSIEPTFFGWFIILSCYPPFNTLSGQVLGWGANDYAFFGSEIFTFIMRLFVLLPLITFYFSATLALGFKSSNLTNRGIVTKFPYNIIRHPAYAGKTLFWLITSLVTGNAWLIFSMVLWMAVYYIRGIVEENHLKKDPAYRQYLKKVKYRFFPGII